MLYKSFCSAAKYEFLSSGEIKLERARNHSAQEFLVLRNKHYRETNFSEKRGRFFKNGKVPVQFTSDFFKNFIYSIWITIHVTVGSEQP